CPALVSARTNRWPFPRIRLYTCCGGGAVWHRCAVALPDDCFTRVDWERRRNHPDGLFWHDRTLPRRVLSPHATRSTQHAARGCCDRCPAQRARSDAVSHNPLRADTVGGPGIGIPAHLRAARRQLGLSEPADA